MSLLRPRSRQLERRLAGFTLLELLVVMVIITIAFFALRPSFAGAVREAEERNAMRQLVGLFTAARAEAVARGKLIRVAYDPDESAFYPEVQQRPEEDRQLFEPVTLVGKRRVLLPEHLILEGVEVGGMSLAPAEAPVVYFYPDGRTDGAAFLMVRDSGATAVLEILGATGKVSLDG